MEWRDRVVGLERIPAARLLSDPRNWRTHPEVQRHALAGSLERLGVLDVCLVRRDADGVAWLIDGHLRQEMLGDRDVPCLVLDVDADEAGLLLATHDPLAELSEYDPDRLEALLEHAGGDGTLEATVAAIRERYGLGEDGAAAMEAAPLGKAPAALLDTWENGGQRQIMLLYPAGELETVRDALDRVADREGLGTPAATVAWLAARWAEAEP